MGGYRVVHVLLIQERARQCSLEWSEPDSFYRPFTWFLHAQAKMKEVMDGIEIRFRDKPVTEAEEQRTIADIIAQQAQKTDEKDSPDNHKNPTSGPVEFDSGEGDERPGQVKKSLAKRVERHILNDALMESHHTLLELRCYVEFGETRFTRIGRWNGRQIRNAVQIASSLAWYDNKVDKPPGTETIGAALPHRHSF